MLLLLLHLLFYSATDQPATVLYCPPAHYNDTYEDSLCRPFVISFNKLLYKNSGRQCGEGTSHAKGPIQFVFSGDAGERFEFVTVEIPFVERATTVNVTRGRVMYRDRTREDIEFNGRATIVSIKYISTGSNGKRYVFTGAYRGSGNPLHGGGEPITIVGSFSTYISVLND